MFRLLRRFISSLASFHFFLCTKSNLLHHRVFTGFFSLFPLFLYFLLTSLCISRKLKKIIQFKKTEREKEEKEWLQLFAFGFFQKSANRNYSSAFRFRSRARPSSHPELYRAIERPFSPQRTVAAINGLFELRCAAFQNEEEKKASFVRSSFLRREESWLLRFRQKKTFVPI